MFLAKYIQSIFNFFGIRLSRYQSKPNLIFTSLHLKKIRKKSIIFDIGANIGSITNKYLTELSPQSIHTFEPNDEAFKILKTKYLNNKKVILNNCAVGKKKGTKKLNYTLKSGNSSFYKLNPKSKWINEKGNIYKVKPELYTFKRKNSTIITIDDYVKKNKIKTIDLMKIDTQGFEKNVLEGSRNSLKKIIKNIELEIMLDDCYEVNTSFYEIEKILDPFNFKLIGLYSNKRDIFEKSNFGAFVFYSKEN
jgi:FkbM family methyltransferase